MTAENKFCGLCGRKMVPNYDKGTEVWLECPEYTKWRNTVRSLFRSSYEAGRHHDIKFLGKVPKFDTTTGEKLVDK